MDRMIDTAVAALGALRADQVITAQNLANQSVPGFRRDLTIGGKTTFVTALNAATGGAAGGASTSARALPQETPDDSFSQKQGFLDTTGQPLDVAIDGPGYFYVQPQSGKPALSRRGDLQVTASGALENGAGQPMLDSAMQPITVPPFRSIQINDLGQITIEPLQGAPGETQTVATLATVNPQGTRLVKGNDGEIRTPAGTVPAPDQAAKVRQGALEGSNVNSVEELVKSIEIQRTYELNVKLIKEAKDIDASGARLLRMPGA